MEGGVDGWMEIRKEGWKDEWNEGWVGDTWIGVG